MLPCSFDSIVQSCVCRFELNSILNNRTDHFNYFISFLLHSIPCLPLVSFWPALLLSILSALAGVRLCVPFCSPPSVALSTAANTTIFIIQYFEPRKYCENYQSERPDWWRRPVGLRHCPHHTKRGRAPVSLNPIGNWEQRDLFLRLPAKPAGVVSSSPAQADTRVDFCEIFRKF